MAHPNADDPLNAMCRGGGEDRVDPILAGL
jgi:hypothetical protein